MRKLCLSTKFPHQEIRWNYGILRSLIYHVQPKVVNCYVMPLSQLSYRNWLFTLTLLKFWCCFQEISRFNKKFLEAHWHQNMLSNVGLWNFNNLNFLISNFSLPICNGVSRTVSNVYHEAFWLIYVMAFSCSLKVHCPLFCKNASS